MNKIRLPNFTISFSKSQKLNRYAFLFLLLSMQCISSCNKDISDTIPTSNGVYIVNEGNFNFGNADISFYDPKTNAITNNLFQSANGFSLGDVAQSLFIKDSLGFIVVNNSAKIEVVKIPSFTKTNTLTIAGSSPRYFLPINDSLAYVSELYAKKIWVINYNTGNLITTITTQSWTEKMIKIETSVFVQQKYNSLISNSITSIIKINTLNHTVETNKQLAGGDITGMVKDKLDRIWVLQDEDTASNKYAKLYCFDVDLNQQNTLTFSAFGHHPIGLSIDAVGENLCYADGDISRLAITATNLPNQTLFSIANATIYALDIDPATDDIYVADALDYTQASKIYRYDKNGNLIHSFTTGNISGNFSFNYAK